MNRLSFEQRGVTFKDRYWPEISNMRIINREYTYLHIELLFPVFVFHFLQKFTL